MILTYEVDQSGTMSGTVIRALIPHPKGGGTPVCKLYRYVPYQTVCEF